MNRTKIGGQTGPIIKSVIYGFVCDGCIHLRKSLWRSGCPSVFQSFCSHPKIKAEDIIAETRSRTSKVPGRFIRRGQVMKVPKWCPEVTNENH